MTVTSPHHEEATNHALLSRWYAEAEMGQRLSIQFTRLLSEVLEQVFGYQMLVTGADTGVNFSQMVKTQRVFRLTSGMARDLINPGAIGVSSELPFASDSIDALILCHTLDTSSVPHSVLRECQRVLLPNGHLFVISFSPYSLWGLGNWARNRLLRRRRHLRAIGGRQLKDWLSLLGFSYSEPRFAATLPPFGNGRIGQWVRGIDEWLVKHNSPTGSAYLIHARKRVANYLDMPVPAVNRPRPIAMPLGKPSGGVPVPRGSQKLRPGVFRGHE